MHSKDSEISDGETVRVCDKSNQALALGHYTSSGIAVKIFSLNPKSDPQTEISKNINSAIDFRRSLGLLPCKDTNAFRLINAEGDQLPGLIVDLYNDAAVIEYHSRGMQQMQGLICECLTAAVPLNTIYQKFSGGLEDKPNFALGDKSSTEILENGHKFIVDWQSGQKTGFFLDQRENRFLIGEKAKSKSVLNLFCYTGGFSIYCLDRGADRVVSVDSSEGALQTLEKSLSLSKATDKHSSVQADVFDFLAASDNHYDIVIVDPPAFAKHMKAETAALRAYERLALKAVSQVQSGGIMAIFSCSQVISRSAFELAVSRGVSAAGVNGRIINRLSQSACHPQSIAHLEGEYLKGLLISVI